jgi:phosphoglucomutase
MKRKISPLAGRPADPSILVNVPKLVACYYTERPDPAIPAQRVLFGTSGHRGSSFENSFNEWHILAITQAICDHRQANKVDGPLFLGRDAHALSEPAFRSAMEVLSANGVEVLTTDGDDLTPTPAVSHAIIRYNHGRSSGWADGIVITPSHNPPEDGGFKYDPPHGGPAGEEITGAIETRANAILEGGVKEVKRISFDQARRSPTTHSYDFLGEYVNDLGTVIDFEVVSSAKLKLGVDPLGGAGVAYWPRIAERYGLNLSVVNTEIDPTFRFMTVDWDGRIRTDPSSPQAMQRLIALKDKFDIAFACDADHDRHGIVTKSAGLLEPNHYLAVCGHYLYGNRPGWHGSAIGKTIVSSSMIDRVAQRLKTRVYEVPVGFKWFVDGLLAGRLGFAGEESAGSSFLRRDGAVWTTDKDGIAPALLSAEITARLGSDPGEVYRSLAKDLGECYYARVDAPADAGQKARLSKLSATDMSAGELAGEQIAQVLTMAPGDSEPIGGVKVIAKSGWFAARPSGTEEIYKIYAESFVSEQHLERIQDDAQNMISNVLAPQHSGVSQ